MSLNEQVTEARQLIAKESRALQKAVATMPRNEIKDFISAHEFLGTCKQDDSSIETGAMRDAHEWVRTSGDALYKALSTPEFQQLSEEAKIAYATTPKGGVYAVPVAWIIERLQAHPEDGFVHLDEAMIDRIQNPTAV
uniref:Uncharacterized protein n=1 Tax=Pseudomonas phage Cygsa01 TaxID=3138529 RepID=A0AAU6W3J9_9VIRU